MINMNGELCVNALKGATSISTKAEIKAIFAAKMCQCPERGDLHFYEYDNHDCVCLFYCVNALKGATSISTSMLMY